MRYHHIYLSPHYDDAALSCGGAIYQQTQAKQPVLVVTICAAPPPTAKLSAFAQYLHQQWGNPTNMVATRRAEDQQAMALLGVASHYLALHDCIYRGQSAGQDWFYNSDAAIFGDVHPVDMALAATIAQAVADLAVADLGAADSGTTVYAPLGVGHHVDHQLAHAAAWQLHGQGVRVVFYEDYPYADPNYPFTAHGAGNNYKLDKALQAESAAPLRSELRLISEADLTTKIEAVAAYTSQLVILFGGRAEMAAHLRAYALYVGQQHLAERLWLPG